jgi:hypothetical protein
VPLPLVGTADTQVIRNVKHALEKLPAGQFCAFEMISTDPNSSTGYRGRVVRVDGDQVTIDLVIDHTRPAPKPELGSAVSDGRDHSRYTAAGVR